MKSCLRTCASRMVWGCVAGMVIAVTAGPALAHRVNVWAYVESGNTIKGSVGFPGGAKARNVSVTVRAPDGTLLGETQTDEQGEFVFQARFRCDHIVTVDTGDGHRAEYKVAAEELPAGLPPLAAGGAAVSETSSQPSPSASASETPPAPATLPAATWETAIEKVVSRQIVPLRREIEAYRQTVFVHDILGGIGYIVGVFGLIFYLKARAIGKTMSPPK